MKNNQKCIYCAAVEPAEEMLKSDDGYVCELCAENIDFFSHDDPQGRCWGE